VNQKNLVSKPVKNTVIFHAETEPHSLDRGCFERGRLKVARCMFR